MTLNSLNAISPIDGRYRSKTIKLAKYFSEEALIKYRVKVEIEYFIYIKFSSKDAQEIKEIENVTNHDVKAVEYFIKERFVKLKLEQYKEFIHFGLTSQDINNTSIPLSINEAFDHVYYPEITIFIDKLKALALEWKDIPMLARTHGQPASPTRLGKEVLVFIERIEQQIQQLRGIPYAAKFGGATGNFNAHKIAYPNIDWKKFGTHFVEKVLGLHHSYPTTQVEHYDHLAGIFDAMKRINTIIIDLNRDFWTYISMNYFKQKIKKGEVGSSAMPHKVNPIDFENSEGNLGLANAVFEHLSAKLPISRLQRDLTDSTVLRNVGVPFAHTIIGIISSLNGLNKLLLNKEKIEQDLEENWAVVSEAIQTILRRENYPNPYEALKGLTRKNTVINQKTMADFIDRLNVSNDIKKELKAISPSNYTGI